MREILLPWDSQPQEVAGLDRSNPLAAPITHFLPLNGDPRELVSGARLTYSSGGTIVASQRGLALQGTGSTARASIPLNLSAYNFLTISFWMYWDAYANDDKLAMEFSSNSNLNSGTFVIDPNNSSPAGTFSVAVNDGDGITSRGRYFSRPTAADWHHYVFRLRMDGVSTAAGNFVDAVWIDSIAQTLTNQNAYSENLSGSFANSTLYLLSRAGASLYGTGKLQNLAIRGGYLMPAAEVRAEYENPWQLFEPRRIYIPGAAPAGAPSLSAATFASRGSTSVRPRVNVTF